MKQYIGILGAVKEEIAGIRRQMRVEDNFRLERTQATVGQWQGFDVVLARTGMGRKRARAALADVCDRFPLAYLFSIGYAGGLDPALRVGDLVVAEQVLSMVGEEEVNPPALHKQALSSALVNQALLLACPPDTAVYRGALLTVDEVVARPDQKQSLAAKTGAMAVDMETAALACEAETRGIPFLSLRAVTDTAEQELINCDHLVEADGEVSKLKAGWHVLTHPGDLKHLIALRDHAQKATASLTAFLTQFLQNYK